MELQKLQSRVKKVARAGLQGCYERVCKAVVLRSTQLLKVSVTL